jgi:hypothetical protein
MADHRRTAPLDRLTAYVTAMRPGGGPLDDLQGALEVAELLEEQSRALLGYFVDQARAAGASWSQIGASLGISKQAAQKRFTSH